MPGRIVALVKINKSAGALAGKGKTIAGIILGGISVILVPVILVIVGMLYLSTSAVETLERY